MIVYAKNNRRKRLTTIFTIFVLTVAAAEAAIGLAILVIYYRNSGSISVEEINKLRG